MRIGSSIAIGSIALALGTGPATALDPNKRITQYLHTTWHKGDGSDVHGAYSIAQTSDGFLWLVSGDMATFDGVRFTSWDGPPNGGSITKGAPFGQIVNAFGGRAGGLRVFGYVKSAPSMLDRPSPAGDSKPELNEES